MGRAALLISFFTIAPFLLLFCVILLSFYSFQKNNASLVSFSNRQTSSVLYAALPTAQFAIEATIPALDARVESVRQFFARYKSPLEPYAQNIIQAADLYGLDYRLVPAIAMQESNLCKVTPKNSNNCWGFGIYGKKVQMFESYTQAIEVVTKTLAKEYKQKGLETPEQIMTKYTPSSNGSWARGVSHFMAQL